MSDFSLNMTTSNVFTPTQDTHSISLNLGITNPSKIHIIAEKGQLTHQSHYVVNNITIVKSDDDEVYNGLVIAKCSNNFSSNYLTGYSLEITEGEHGNILTLSPEVVVNNEKIEAYFQAGITYRWIAV